MENRPLTAPLLNSIITFLIRSQTQKTAPILPVELSHLPDDHNTETTLQNLNAAFLILLAGEDHAQFSQAQGYLTKLAKSSKWADWANFYLDSVQLGRTRAGAVLPARSRITGKISKCRGNAF
jgi:hypothetical protein